MHPVTFAETEGSVHVVTQELLREEPKFTQHEFSRLLAWLDDGVDSQGETYLEMRRRLVSYFDRRNRRFADDLADETLNRIGRTLQKCGVIEITPPARYCYIVARFVLLEDIRRERQHIPVDEGRMPALHAAAPAGASDEGSAKRQQRLDCLDRCLVRLKPDHRELVVEYYRDAKRQRIDRRRELAARLGITMNALGIRLCRIRSGLETCVGACCGERVKDFGARAPIRAGR